jgi:hypothetical protein
MFARALFLLAVLSALTAGGLTAPTRAAAAEPLCVLLVPDGAGEMLVNRCHGCREVMLQRVREGEGIPNVRSLVLPGQAAVPTPFHGPGRTRILGERSCPPPPRGMSEAAIWR